MSARFLAATLALTGLMMTPPTLAQAQGMLDMVDLQSDAFTKSEMSRADIEAGLAKLKEGEKLNLFAKALNGLDLSGLDLRRTNLQAARLNGTNLKGANLEGVVMDQAWLIGADLTDVKLANSSLFGTQFKNAKLDNADLSGARIAADFTMTRATNATFDGADLSADEENQSMGLMRGSFQSAILDGSSFKDANLKRVLMEYTSAKNVNFENAQFNESELGGSDFTGANVAGADFDGADVNSARIGEMKNANAAKNIEKTKNLERAYR